MKVLLVNKFLYPRGGAPVSTLNTGRLLSERGHQVLYWGMAHPANPAYPTESYFVPHVDLEAPATIGGKLRISGRIIYSREAGKQFERLIRDERPDIVHLNNFAHQISPSIIPVLKKHRVPSVMTIRDYKLVCPAYLLLRRGRPCQDCAGGRYYRCLLGRCVKGSRAKSLLNTLEMYIHHRLLKIYDGIDLFIATSRFLRTKCREMGLEREIVILPNFIFCRDYRPDFTPRRGPLAYFGRLSREKGLETLIAAVEGLGVGLKMIGDGPMRKQLEETAGAGVRFTGWLEGEALRREVRSSSAVVVPSEYYEPFGRTVIEAYALGKPVVGSRMGGIPEMIREGETGFTFPAGNAAELRERLRILLDDPAAAAAMGRAGRALAEEKFGEELHYRGLIEIYRRVGARDS